MAHTLTFEPHPGYLRFTVTGDNTVADVVAYINEVGTICNERSCSNVLIIEDLKGPGLSTLEVFNVVTHIDRRALQFARIIAYVDINPEHEFRLMEFAETVARNRGIFVRTFPNLPDAEAWIEAKVAKTQTAPPEA